MISYSTETTGFSIFFTEMPLKGEISYLTFQRMIRKLSENLGGQPDKVLSLGIGQ